MFRKGQSGNPSGRPKGAAGLARYAAERTNNGQDMIDILIQLATDPETPVRERLGACQAVLDRAAGKPSQSSEISLSLSQVPSFDRPSGWDELGTHERLSLLQDWRQRILAPAIDVPETEDE